MSKSRNKGRRTPNNRKAAELARKTKYGWKQPGDWKGVMKRKR